MPAKKLSYGKYLYQGTSAETHQRAIRLRRTETDAEKKLWSLLRNRQLSGRKFRRQHPFTDFILDFYCHECRLGIELDGMHHFLPDNAAYDDARTGYIKEYGVTVIRFRNAEVINEPEKVLEKIAEWLVDKK